MDDTTVCLDDIYNFSLSSKKTQDKERRTSYHETCNVIN